MNTRIGREKFGNFLILLDSGRISTTMMNNLTSKLKLRYYSTNMWPIQAGNFNTNYMETLGFFLIEFSATKIVT